MHQFAKYIKEREDFESIVVEGGFACYRINGDECYIRDIWTDPDLREAGLASALADQIAHQAKKFGCRYLTGSVNPSVGDPTASTKVLLSYGFKVFSAVQGGIFFRKEL